MATLKGPSCTWERGWQPWGVSGWAEEPQNAPNDGGTELLAGTFGGHGVTPGDGSGGSRALGFGTNPGTWWWTLEVGMESRS